jgi:hypothetical protein
MVVNEKIIGTSNGFCEKFRRIGFMESVFLCELNLAKQTERPIVIS